MKTTKGYRPDPVGAMIVVGSERLAASVAPWSTSGLEVSTKVTWVVVVAWRVGTVLVLVLGGVVARRGDALWCAVDGHSTTRATQSAMAMPLATRARSVVVARRTLLW